MVCIPVTDIDLLQWEKSNKWVLSVEKVGVYPKKSALVIWVLFEKGVLLHGGYVVVV